MMLYEYEKWDLGDVIADKREVVYLQADGKFLPSFTAADLSKPYIKEGQKYTRILFTADGK